MTVPARLRTLISMLVVVFLLPGMSELLETVEHLLHDGHLPHSEQHDDQRQHDEASDLALDDEHGCTAMTHSCGCHLSAPALLNDPPIEDGTLLFAMAEARPIIGERSLHSRANAPPTPPPIVSV